MSTTEKQSMADPELASHFEERLRETTAFLRTLPEHMRQPVSRFDFHRQLLDSK